ncbi:hypothetical protein [Mesorhizobium sp.]|uniref:hypothetical protein n=1 Tax=Mesorhizobium sp. TaxID=1871066 RepID=UPI00257EFDC0|nr:hypothetical protein [Mesorhizobium sp.]
MSDTGQSGSGGQAEITLLLLAVSAMREFHQSDAVDNRDLAALGTDKVDIEAFAGPW